jgi:hypothetical protein
MISRIRAKQELKIECLGLWGITFLTDRSRTRAEFEDGEWEEEDE